MTLRKLLRILPKVPEASLLVLRYAPLVLKIILRLNKGKTLESVFSTVNLADTYAPKVDDVKSFKTQVLKGARWSTYLLMPRTKGRCFVRSLTVFEALNTKGFPASFVTGVNRTNGELKSHAWVELNGQALIGSGDERARQSFKVNLEYPQQTPS